MHVSRIGIEVGLPFSQETAFNVHENGFLIPETYQYAKCEKYETFLCQHAFNLAPKKGPLRSAILFDLYLQEGS